MTSVLSRRGQSRVARPACSKYILAIRKWLVGCEQRTPGLEDLRSSVLTVVWLSLASFPGLHRFHHCSLSCIMQKRGRPGNEASFSTPCVNLPTHLLITPLPSFSSFHFPFSLLSLPPSLLSPPSLSLYSSIPVSIPLSLPHPSPFPSFSFLKKVWSQFHYYHVDTPPTNKRVRFQLSWKPLSVEKKKWITEGPTSASC